MSRVSPTEKRPTHHIRLRSNGSEVSLILCDGNGQANKRAFSRDPMPRSALKTYSGQQTYADMEPPWTPISQSDFTGGRGSYNLDTDAQRYYDGARINTLKASRTLPGGQEVYTYGHRGSNIRWSHKKSTGDPITYSWYDLGDEYLATKFVTTSAYSATYVYLVVRRQGATGNLTVAVCANDAGGSKPGTVLETGTVVATNYSTIGEAYHIRIQLANTESLSSATTYWLKVYGGYVSPGGYSWEILTVSGDAADYASGDDVSYIQVNYGMFYRVTDGDKDFKPHFFEYKRSLYAALAYDDASAFKLYLNGDQGCASSGSTTTLADTAKSWTTNEWVGCKLIIFNGAGEAQPTNYSTITGNTATELTFEALAVAVAQDSEYSIVGSDKWTEITGHSITKPPTDVLQINGIAYFALGDDTVIKRMRRYVSTHTWTTNWNDEAEEAYYLCSTPKDGGGDTIWRAAHNTTSLNRAPAVNTWTDLVWSSTSTTVGDSYDRITNLISYEEGANLYVHKEGSIYEIVQVTGEADTPTKLQIGEMNGVQDPRNGLAVLHHNVYLYFSLLDGLERYNQGQIDNIGPDTDEGLPINRVGNITALAGYPGRFYAAVAGAGSNYSSVECYYNSGWHDMWQSWVINDDPELTNTSEVGPKCTNVFVQSIPGSESDRLWIGCGSEILWIPITIDATKSIMQEGYYFTWEARLITSWMYLGMQDVDKYFHSISLIFGNESSGSSVAIDYRLDDSEDWTFLTTVTDADNGVKKLLSATYNKSGKKIQFRFRFYQAANNSALILSAIVLEAATRVPHKYTSTLTYRLIDDDVDLNGAADEVPDIDDKRLILETMASLPIPVVIDSISKVIHGRYAFVDPSSMRMLHRVVIEGREGWVCQMTLIEIT